ncbi:spermidine/putrescine ABC transporter substrate-binding protein [Vibrio azureus]|uniref:Spermidine/putrescine ABC transporter substrate-binding protein n=1 Tax=Vibrio azureus NBRC 104587 TaxID=1219077 RepID=U3AKK1_9VIBR|nr:extracellular solute-binding protein [Vibrio azureus]AUI85978.1 spermidine/putrescine ABC transporter substrate-binding protein [Vibrio azureus]GAD74285.1 hypothetical protein VAZ01S_008_00270 [Vibrio azureus NBRC 104587]
MQPWRFLFFYTAFQLAQSTTTLASEVYLYNWDEFLSTKVIERLKNEEGITLKQQYFSDESIRDEVLISERRRSFQLAVIESVKLQTLGKQGIFNNLSALRSKLSDLYDKRWFDACGDYGLPYAWGTTGILYRRDKIPQPESWASLLNPSVSLKSKISMYYEPIDLISTALLVNGFTPFTSDLNQIKKAYETLVQQKPLLGSQEYILDYVKSPIKLASIDIAFGYSGDSYVLNEIEQKNSWAYSVPIEGTTIWLECLAAINHGPISNDVANTLRFLSKADVAAQNAMDSWFATPSSKAKELASDEYRLDEELFPPQDVLDRSYLYKPLDMKSLQIRSRIVEDLRN